MSEEGEWVSELVGRLAQGQAPARAFLLSSLGGGELSRRALRGLLLQGSPLPGHMSEEGPLRLALALYGALRAHPARALRMGKRLLAYLARNRKLLEEMRARQRAEALRALVMACTLGLYLPLLEAVLPLLSGALGKAAQGGAWLTLWGLGLLLSAQGAALLYYRGARPGLWLGLPALCYLLGLGLASALRGLLPG